MWILEGKNPKSATQYQTVRFVHFLEDISAPRTRINLSFAALEPWYKSNYLEYHKPQLKDKKKLALRGRQDFST